MRDFHTIFFEAIPSTMDVAKKIAKTIYPAQNNILVISTRHQTAGRGQGGSLWIHKKNSVDKVEPSDASGGSDASGEIDLAEGKSFDDLSLATKTHIDFFPVTFVFPGKRVKIPPEWLTSLVGAAIHDALTSTYLSLAELNQEKTFYIKWPNDIITAKDNKKVCGILCELSYLQSQAECFFIGVGLNFFTHPDLKHATSFYNSVISAIAKTGKSLSTQENTLLKEQIVERFSAKLKENLLDYLCTQRTREELKDIVLSRSVPLGTFLSVNKNTLTGEFLGIDDNGGLLLKGASSPIYSASVNLLSPVVE